MYGLPYHQLTFSQTRMWVHLGPIVRKTIAAAVVKGYKDGCVIVAFRGHIIAMVAPNGQLKELQPPFKTIDSCDVANRPSPSTCVCQGFFDPEVGGPWSARGGTEHHPYCEFDKVSRLVYPTMLQTVQAAGGASHVRPDEHIRTREKILGKRGEKTGARSR